MKCFYSLFIISVLIASCNKDELTPYQTNNYIFLTNDSSNVIEYSFAFHPGVTSDTVPVVISLIGQLSEQDRSFILQVDPGHSTALDNDYTLPAQILFGANKAKDTIALVLHKSDRLATDKYKIRLSLATNEHFQLGPVTNRHIDIVFSDMIARPGWWNSIITNNFLSQYSDTKYRLFIEATGIADMTDLSETEQRAYAIIFRDFLARGREGGAVYEDENGMINVSPNLN